MFLSFHSASGGWCRRRLSLHCFLDGLQGSERKKCTGNDSKARSSLSRGHCDKQTAEAVRKMSNILYDARWIGPHGIGRFAAELAKSLPELRTFQRGRRPWHPLDPALLGLELWRDGASLFFSPGYNSPVGWPKPFVFTLHDLNHICVTENSNALKRAYYQLVIKPACHRAAYVLTVSEYSRREIASWAGMDEQRVVNVGNGVGDPFTVNG